MRQTRILVKRAQTSVWCLCFRCESLLEDYWVTTVWTLGFGVKVYKLRTQLFLEKRWMYTQTREEAEVQTCIFASLLLKTFFFGPKTIHRLGDFWWHCCMWKPTVMQSRGNLRGKLLIQVSSETLKTRKQGNQVIFFSIALGFINLTSLPLYFSFWVPRLKQQFLLSMKQQMVKKTRSNKSRVNESRSRQGACVAKELKKNTSRWRRKLIMFFTSSQKTLDCD